MSHASHSHDALEVLAALRDDVERQRERIEAMATKLEKEQAMMEVRLALANALAFIKDVDTRNMSTGKRVQRNGVMEQLRKAMA